MAHSQGARYKYDLARWGSRISLSEPSGTLAFFVLGIAPRDVANAFTRICQKSREIVATPWPAEPWEAMRIRIICVENKKYRNTRHLIRPAKQHKAFTRSAAHEPMAQSWVMGSWAIGRPSHRAAPLSSHSLVSRHGTPWA